MEIKRNQDLHIRKSKQHVVAFIHGIFSSPSHYKDLIEQFTELDYSIYAISLHPHSDNPREYLKLHKDSWIEQVNDTLDLLLNKYENVYIISHSLGGLLSIEYEHINQIKKLVLWAPALKPRLTFKSIQIGLANMNKPQSDEYLEFCRTKGSVSPRNIAERAFLLKPSLHLLYNIKNARKKLKNVHIPTLVIVSKNDESVQFSTGKLAEREMDCCEFQLLELEKSLHNDFSNEERDIVYTQIIDFITKKETC
mgnify:CR=1 FL=1